MGVLLNTPPPTPELLNIDQPSTSPSSSPSFTPSLIPTSVPTISQQPTAVILTQVGSPVTGTEDNEKFGYKIDLSKNGTDLSIGAPFYNGNGTKTGLAQIYNKGIIEWKQVGQNLYGSSNNDEFGRDVKISSNGKWAVINGGWNRRGDTYVKVFRIINDQWRQMGQTLVNDNANGFGVAVSLSGNGLRLAVGAQSAVFVYEYKIVSNAWNVIGGTIGEINIVTVKLSDDGSRLVVGAPFYSPNTTSTNIGRLRVFDIDGDRNRIKQVGDTMYGSAKDDKFGNSVALSTDGSIVAAGTYGVGTDGGNYARVFQFVGNWTQLGDDLVGTNLDDKAFGWDVSLSGEGNKLAVSSVLYNKYMGRIVIFRLNIKNAWANIVEVTGLDTYDQEGFSVSMSANGKYFATSAIEAGSNGLIKNGRIRIFRIVEV